MESYTMDDARRELTRSTLVLIAIAIVLGVLHFLWGDLREGGVYWFNLDKERNLPTWFTGVLLLGMSCTSVVAWSLERRRLAEGAVFRLPILWLGLAALFAFFALDETTVLHENLFWREVREVSVSMGDTWKYLTQWQVLFAPAILLVVAYLVVFFINRYRLSPSGQRLALAGIGCWIAAIGLEAVRGVLRQGEPGFAYQLEVALEEVCEMIGAILILAAMVRYVLELHLEFGEERQQRLAESPALLSRRALRVLSVMLGALAVIGAIAFWGARHQARQKAPVPSLIERAVPDHDDVDEEPAADEDGEED